MSNDPIGDALNLTPLQPLLTNSQKKSLTPSDFEYARGNLINILEKGGEALDSILDVAQQSQQPRAFEVVATLIKTLADTNKDLLDLQKKQKDLDNMNGPQTPQTINNNLFVGSTAELQKLIKQNNEQK
ncbi:MAG: terminase [Proteobacteria bacterium]|jgi:hypothetical protein|nr:terminase [Pseudomonadota bacterium]